MTLMQPPGCNFCSNVPKEHPENTSQALGSVDTIGGQVHPTIFAEADSVSFEPLPAHCSVINIFLHTNNIFIFILWIHMQIPNRKYSDL